MDVPAKLRILADAAKYDAACASSESTRARTRDGLGNAAPGGICHSFTPDGRCVSLLKILLTNYCIYDCAYCVNRVSSDTPRARFTVAEVVDLTIEFYKRNYIEGLFLSSGIIQSPDYTMEQMVAIARELRATHRFCGYIHLKGVPGASKELLAQAARYADRVSVNIEMALQRDLDRLAPAKRHDQIEAGMAQIAAAPPQAGQTTQMVIGATPATDADILATAGHLYKEHALRRVYYSAFSPIPHAASDLPVQPAPLVREHRLYQADWLVRHYGFAFGELTTSQQPNLSLDADPKLAWALRHREFFPIDVNVAPKEALLRVPGFGVRNVERILKIRRYHRIAPSDLAKMRIPLRRAQPFIVTGDIRARNLDALTIPIPEQLPLFTAREALTGEF
jgi:putative DNA modification/repair radical SAM protein